MEEENVMIDISLTREEREILSEVLDRTIGELKREIVFTDRRAFRDDLRLRRELLERLSDALHGRAERYAHWLDVVPAPARAT